MSKVPLHGPSPPRVATHAVYASAAPWASHGPAFHVRRWIRQPGSQSSPVQAQIEALGRPVPPLQHQGSQIPIAAQAHPRAARVLSARTVVVLWSLFLMASVLVILLSPSVAGQRQPASRPDAMGVEEATALAQGCAFLAQAASKGGNIWQQDPSSAGAGPQRSRPPADSRVISRAPSSEVNPCSACR
jgi:hypothetical protein